MSYFIGSTLPFSKLFATSAGTATNPTLTRFLLREEIDGTELEWIYNAVPVSGTHYPVGMNPITTSATGTFALAFVARKAERHAGIWLGTGAIVDSSQQTFFVRHPDVRAIDHP